MALLKQRVSLFFLSLPRSCTSTVADRPCSDMTESHSAYEATQSPCTPHSGPGVTNDGHLVDATLNYAFVRPGGLPSPLPLTIPQALLNAPTADLRPILLEKLEAEGVTLKLGEIRFWRTVQPLEIACAVDDCDVWIQKEGAERKFKVVPFTESLLSSFGDWIQDRKLLHLIVTGGEAPFILEPAMPDPSTLSVQIPASQSIAIGRYSVQPERQSWQDVREGERRSQDIQIIQTPLPSGQTSGDNPSIQTPTVLLGISYLDTTSHGDDIQLLTHVSNVHPESFRAHFDSFGRTFLYAGSLSWMAITPHHVHPTPYEGGAIQCGIADSHTTHPRKIGRRYSKQRVLFRQAYEQTPNVFSCLAGLNVGGSGSTHWDIRTYVTGIDREGFTLHIEKARDSERDVNEVVVNAQISWVAFRSGGAAGQKLACGEGHLVDGVRTQKNERNTVEWRGRLVFTEAFTSPPQVFAAFTSFDVDKSAPVRLVLGIESVTREGIEWKVGTYCDTVAYDATFAYFAVGDL
ncbi:hypothetical protein BKA70DRAFT_1401632 [Coprinopsis sp. MPI-PUGE-AT-0042]|nr:hypothetical protein BKA70DRAFT_1401632 [Coprinopsis sp. MPI-PUGE-AT-0042]